VEPEIPEIEFVNPLSDLGDLNQILNVQSLLLLGCVLGTVIAFFVSWVYTLILDRRQRARVERLRRNQFLEMGQLASGVGMDKLEVLDKSVLEAQRLELQQQQQSGAGTLLLLFEQHHVLQSCGCIVECCAMWLGNVFVILRYIYRSWIDGLRRDHTIMSVFFPSIDDQVKLRVA
jgi:hypothetical protein